jgi:UDP-glucose 4-epimerase
MKKQKKAIVTGGAGFIGSHLTDALIKKGFRVAVIDNLYSGSLNNINPKAKFVKMDIRSPKIADVFRSFKPEYIFHAAAQISVSRSIKDPMFDADVNVLGSINLMKNAVEHGVKKFIFSSTGGALPGLKHRLPAKEDDLFYPASGYGVAKLAVEKYLGYYQQKYGLEYVALRYANVYGPRQDAKGEAGVVAIFCCNILDGKVPVIHGNGSQTRDYVFVQDVVKASLLSLNKKARGPYNVASGKETTVKEIFQLIAKEFYFKNKPEFDPSFDSGVPRSVLNPAKIKKELGWQYSVKLEDGIRQTVHWFIDHRKEKICKELLCAFCYEGI